MSEKLFNVGIKGIIVRDGKVLILKNKGISDGWEVPGGRIDANETIEDTLIRELKEELPNVTDISIGEMVGAQRIQKDIKPDVSLVLVFFSVTADFDGEEPKLSNEHSEYKWADRKEALDLVYAGCRGPISKALDASLQK
jgi:8-oxo-dGTP pyrophosphatase MutT (NUDIX family)